MQDNYRAMETMGLWNSKIIGLWNWNISQYMMIIWILTMNLGSFSLGKLNNATVSS